MALALFFLGLVLDFSVLYSKRNPAFVQRILPDRLSNGEENTVYWELQNLYPFRARIQLIDEFPEVWQLRDFKLKTVLEPGDRKIISFIISPKERGEFFFGNLHICFKTPIQLIQRRKTFLLREAVKVYPGFLRLRQFEFMAHITDPGNTGYKQVRKTGHSLEFEQIREYVSGDDIRSINW